MDSRAKRVEIEQIECIKDHIQAVIHKPKADEQRPLLVKSLFGCESCPRSRRTRGPSMEERFLTILSCKEAFRAG